MVTIPASAVKALREKTDLPMMECKHALVEAEGDEARAIEILKQKAGRAVEKRADNRTAEGRVFFLAQDDGSEAAMVEIQCESAPVASGENMANFGEMMVRQLLHGPGAETTDELLAQTAGDSGRTLQEIFDEMVGKIREKIVVNRLARVCGPVGGYVHHDGKTGVLFLAEGEDLQHSILRDVAMHIAALRPAVCSAEELNAADVEAERERLSAEARDTGKPENIIEKIVEGRMKNFYIEQGVLSLQPFAKDDTKSVSQVLAENGFKSRNFHRWVIGN
jgi:elongation factor Ts